MNECFNGNKEPWKRWPRRMLRHKAYIQGARIAFGFSGIYDEDEAQRIVEAQAVEVNNIKPEVEEPKSLSEQEAAPRVEPEAEKTAESPLNKAQEAAILQLAHKCFKKEDDFVNWLGEFGVEKLSQLTFEQAKKVITELSKKVKDNG